MNEIEEVSTILSKYKLIKEDQILFEFEDDFDLFEGLFLDYQACYSKMFSELKCAYENGDVDVVQITAHTIKGVVVNFYSDELTNAAFEIELMGRNGDLSHFEQKFNQFVNYNDGVIAELGEFIRVNKIKEKKSI